STFAPEIGAEVAAGMRSVGVEVVEDATVVGVEADDGRVVAAQVSDGSIGRTLPTDHVVVALGVIPATDFLAHTDLLCERGALRPDDRGRVAPGVWAAGDCCEVRSLDGFWTYAPLGTHAVKAGRVLG